MRRQPKGVQETKDAQERREYYLNRAREAEALAVEVKDTEARASLLQLAEGWRQLAEHVSGVDIQTILDRHR